MILPGRVCLLSLVEAFYPERCLLCAADTTLLPHGRTVPGLRAWDRPHLCRACHVSLRREGPLHGRRGTLEVWAGAPTGARLVALVSAWKYRGVRGTAWPLACLAARALCAASPAWRGCSLVPLPVHAGRRRERGFDQARILADLLAVAQGIPVRHELLTRVRATPQQAKLDPTDGARQRNVRNAFAAPSAAGGEPPLLLVDDLVTSGATAAAAVELLNRRGWRVSGVLSCGLSLSSA